MGTTGGSSSKLLCVCGEDLQPSQRKMDASPDAKHGCVCVLHVKHTADLCHHWILLWLTTGHKGQSVSALFISM